MAWVTVIAAAVVVLVLFAFALWLLWRGSSAEDRRTAKRIVHLPWRAKLRLAGAIARDRRIPIAARVIPPALVLYLAMPFDLVPDFIPVLGQLDDLAILIIGAGLLLRFTPRQALEDHLRRLETPTQGIGERDRSSN